MTTRAWFSAPRPRFFPSSDSRITTGFVENPVEPPRHKDTKDWPQKGTIGRAAGEADFFRGPPRRPSGPAGPVRGPQGHALLRPSSTLGLVASCLCGWKSIGPLKANASGLL